MNYPKPLVIVLSRNYSTGLGLIRSLGAAGYPVDLIASTKKKGSSIIASCSKYIRNSVEVLTPKIQGDSGSGLIEVLMEYTKKYKEKMVLFPADDFTASVIASNHTVLKDHFLLPGVKEGAAFSLLESMDKNIQGEIARKVGMLTPFEWAIPLSGDIVIPQGVTYPCFVKPLQSISGSKMEMAVCNGREELEKHLLGMKAFYRDRSALVQEYLNIDKEYDLSGVCFDQEVIIPAIIEKTRIAKYELGVTMSGKIIPLDMLGELKTKITELLREFHYTGMFDMELHLCGDKIYFNEVNFRSGGPNFAYFLNGVNLPDILVKGITGKKHNPEDEKIETFGKTFVYEKVAWEDYIYSYMTKQELKQCIEEADFTLLANCHDPKPGKIFYKRIRLSALKKRIKMILGQEARDGKQITSNSRQGKNKNKSNEAAEKKSIVVTGRNYGNILAMSRALGEAGYEVEVLRVFKKKPHPVNLLSKMKPDSHSKYVKVFCQCVANENPLRIVDCLIDMSDSDQKKLLIPVDDYLACTVDENLKQLSEFYVVPNIENKAGEISRLMDKNEQKKLAAAFHLPMLRSSLIKSESGTFEIPSNVHYPCFVKPNVSMKSTKAKMMKCENRQELEQLLTRYAKIENFEMLVEDFAEIKTEYSILGLSTGNESVAPGIFKVIEGGHKERKGVALQGELISSTCLQPLIEKCNKFIESLNYTGLFDVDLIETKDGDIYFVELNFRAGASIHALTATGVNLPEMYAKYLINGIPINKNSRSDGIGKRFISEKVLIEEYTRSDANLSKVRQSMDTADLYFIKDEKDPQPYRYFKRFYIIAYLMRIPYRLRDCRKN